MRRKHRPFRETQFHSVPSGEHVTQEGLAITLIQSRFATVHFASGQICLNRVTSPPESLANRSPQAELAARTATTLQHSQLRRTIPVVWRP